MVFQAANGSAHLLRNDKAYKYFVEEWNRVAGRELELLEDIDPVGRIVRINLAKAKLLGMNPDDIWEKVVKSASSFPENIDQLKEYWAFAKIWMIKQGNFSDIDELSKSIEDKHFEQFHHSKLFNEEYIPSYRLVLRKLIERK